MAAVSTLPPVEIVVTLAPRPIAGAQVRGVRSAAAAVGALLSRDVLGALGLDVISIEGIEPCEPPELAQAEVGAEEAAAARHEDRAEAKA
jgi:hypothetical protein